MSDVVKLYCNDTLSSVQQAEWLKTTRGEGIARRIRIWGVSIRWLFIGILRLERESE